MRPIINNSNRKKDSSSIEKIYVFVGSRRKEENRLGFPSLIISHFISLSVGQDL